MGCVDFYPVQSGHIHISVFLLLIKRKFFLSGLPDELLVGHKQELTSLILLLQCRKIICLHCSTLFERLFWDMFPSAVIGGQTQLVGKCYRFTK